MKFLIDECLSLSLVTVARQAGYEAHHIVRVGKAGWKDWNVLRFAIEEDFVLVTNNASDFRRLYAKEPLHVGLVIILPNVGKEAQQQLFLGVFRELEMGGDPMNQVIESFFEGGAVECVRYDLPPAA